MTANFVSVTRKHNFSGQSSSINTKIDNILWGLAPHICSYLDGALLTCVSLLHVMLQYFLGARKTQLKVTDQGSNADC